MNIKNFETRQSIVSMGCGQTWQTTFDWYQNKNNTAMVEVSVDGNGAFAVHVNGRQVFEAKEHECRGAPDRDWNAYRCESCKQRIER